MTARELPEPDYVLAPQPLRLLPLFSECTRLGTPNITNRVPNPMMPRPFADIAVPGTAGPSYPTSFSPGANRASRGA